MAITVGELVAIPYLGTRLHAGAGGTDRVVTWAHSCEVPNPWNWLDEGDLLMTNGYSLPADPGGQVQFVSELAAAGISGLAIGDQQLAPPITPEMTARADEVALPLLFTAYEVPFIAVARAVADANQREEQARLLQTVRLYDRVREAAIKGGDDGELLDRLGEDLRGELYVVDISRCASILPRRAPVQPALAAAIVEAMRERQGGPVPALSRVTVGETTALIVPVPSQREALLVAVPRTSRRPDLAILQHVATIAALQVERQTAEREERRRLGAEFLAQLIDGRIDASAAQHQLEARGLGGEPLVIVACGDGGGRQGGTLHHGLTDRETPHLLLRRGAVLLVALPEQPDAVAVLREELGPDVHFGVSDVFQGPGRATDAVRGALWAYQAAMSEDTPVVHYGERSALFLPRTLGEAESAVRKVLGRLIDYDAAQSTELVRSLKVFLLCNRSWQRASKELFVHKQTLVYRMRRVEELTGRKLDDTPAVAELWFALCALEFSQEPDSAP